MASLGVRVTKRNAVASDTLCHLKCFPQRCCFLSWLFYSAMSGKVTQTSFFHTLYYLKHRLLAHGQRGIALQPSLQLCADRRLNPHRDFAGWYSLLFQWALALGYAWKVTIIPPFLSESIVFCIFPDKHPVLPQFCVVVFLKAFSLHQAQTSFSLSNLHSKKWTLQPDLASLTLHREWRKIWSAKSHNCKVFIRPLFLDIALCYLSWFRQPNSKGLLFFCENSPVWLLV